MKELIACCIIIPLLLSIVSQYGLQVKNDRNMNRVDNIVNSVKEEAREKGCFTDDLISNMTQSIESLGFSSVEITIDVTTTPIYREDEFDENNLIEYSVGVPIKKIIAANDLFGIADDENKTTYYVKGNVTSELLESE